MGSAISDMHLSLCCLCCSRPAYKQPCLSSGLHAIQPPTLEWRDVSGAGGIVQQHQITNNFPICIFLRMVRHLCLMHLPVHPKGAAKLKEQRDSRHLLKDVSEIGTLRENKIDDSDNQNGLKTNSLWIIFSWSYLCASGKQKQNSQCEHGFSMDRIYIYIDIQCVFDLNIQINTLYIKSSYCCQWPSAGCNLTFSRNWIWMGCVSIHIDIKI